LMLSRRTREKGNGEILPQLGFPRC
jgi:hypothetical protein